MVNPKKPRTPCLTCGKEPAYASYKYCSNACQLEYQHRRYIERWRRGEVTGLQTIGIVSPYIKNHLRRKYNNKCCLCGWSKINPKSKVVPLVADHIDGNWRNNTENNLRLLCPNCDSLTATYAALNKGNGRRHRAASNRAKEGREFLKDIARNKRLKIMPFTV